MNEEQKEKYSAHIALSQIGEAGQKKLLRAKVLVIGAGGLGCPALIYLASSGIGTIGIVDHDLISLSNLPRQPLYDVAMVGTKKVEQAALRLRRLNRHAKIVEHDMRLEPKNASQLISQYDVVLDCTDDIPTRYLINDTCIMLKKPFVYAGIHQFEGQLSVFNYKNGPTYRCLFPEHNKHHLSIRCSESGVMSPLPGILGAWQANETMKVILESEEVLSGRMMILNSHTNSCDFISISRSHHADLVVQNSHDEIPEITADDLSKRLYETKDALQLIDVRERIGNDKESNLRGEHLPVRQLLFKWKELDLTKPIILYCQRGITSAKATKLILEQHENAQVLSLKGGLEAWRLFIKTNENEFKKN